jgi:hypothetical protein
MKERYQQKCGQLPEVQKLDKPEVWPGIVKSVEAEQALVPWMSCWVDFFNVIKTKASAHWQLLFMEE